MTFRLTLKYAFSDRSFPHMSDMPNYITPTGWQALKDELYQLVHKERPEIVQVVNWAASNGDRSENGDYLMASDGCVKSTAVFVF